MRVHLRRSIFCLQQSVYKPKTIFFHSISIKTPGTSSMLDLLFSFSPFFLILRCAHNKSICKNVILLFSRQAYFFDKTVISIFSLWFFFWFLVLDLLECPCYSHLLFYILLCLCAQKLHACFFCKHAVILFTHCMFNLFSFSPLLHYVDLWYAVICWQGFASARSTNACFTLQPIAGTSCGCAQSICKILIHVQVWLNNRDHEAASGNAALMQKCTVISICIVLLWNSPRKN